MTAVPRYLPRGKRTRPPVHPHVVTTPLSPSPLGCLPLQIGDIVRAESNHSFPADLVMLSRSVARPGIGQHGVRGSADAHIPPLC